MLSLYDVSAWIEVDGKELEQYGVEEDFSYNQVTCWIATQANKSFSIVFRDNAENRGHSLCSVLELDGSTVNGKILRPSMFFAGNRTVVQSGQVSSTTSSRPFIFSKLELTDEDEYLDQSSARLGEVRISIYRVQALDSNLFQSGSNASGHGRIHERSKKAITHSVSYGQEVKTTTQYSCRVRHLDGNVPLATFIFKYRDFSLLQASGIIPKPPPTKKEAAPSQDVLDLTTDDDSNTKRERIDEEIEIVDNTTQKRMALVPSKRSNPRHESEAQPAKKVKQEEKLIFTGEVIDLT